MLFYFEDQFWKKDQKISIKKNVNYIFEPDKFETYRQKRSLWC